MVKILSCLLLLLLTLSNANANYCYWNGSRYNSDCWACSDPSFPAWWKQSYCGGVQSCVPRVESRVDSCPSGYTGAITYNRNIMCANPYQEVVNDWYVTSNTCTPTCQVETQTQILSCPVNYSGSITQTKTKSCPSGVWGSWITTNNTCVQNPPSCQISSQTQTLSCQEGYVGAINQTRTSSCPDPYGQPVWNSWLTSSNTCVKSVTNVTNVLSPISPISPTNPTSVVNQSISTPAPTTPSAPATVQTNVQTTPTTTETQSQTDTGGSVAPQTASPATSTPAPTVAPKSETKQTANTPNSPKVNTVVGALIKFEAITQPSIKQPDLFPIISINQAIPESIRRNQDLYFQFIQGETIDFGGEQDIRMNAIKQFTLEYENGFE